MPRSVWTAAGQELQNMGQYFDKRADEQTRADEYATMVGMRKQSMLNQMAQQERQAEKDKQQAAYDQQMMEFKKNQEAASLEDRNLKRQDEDRKRQGIQKLSELVGARLTPVEGQPVSELTDQEYGLMALQSGASPEDAARLYPMFKGRSVNQQPTLDEKFEYQKKLIDYKRANPQPATPRDARTPEMKRAQALDANSASGVLAENMFARDQLSGAYGGKPMQRDIMGATDPLYGSMNNAMIRTSEDLANYRKYNVDPKMAQRLATRKEVDRLRIDAGLQEGDPTPQSFYYQAAQTVLQASQ